MIIRTTTDLIVLLVVAIIMVCFGGLLAFAAGIFYFGYLIWTRFYKPYSKYSKPNKSKNLGLLDKKKK